MHMQHHAQVPDGPMLESSAAVKACERATSGTRHGRVPADLLLLADHFADGFVEHVLPVRNRQPQRVIRAGTLHVLPDPLPHDFPHKILRIRDTLRPTAHTCELPGSGGCGQS